MSSKTRYVSPILYHVSINIIAAFDKDGSRMDASLVANVRCALAILVVSAALIRKYCFANDNLVYSIGGTRAGTVFRRC